MQIESTYPNPPQYYKDFGNEMELLLSKGTPGFHLEPPPPMNEVYWSNGVLRNPTVW